MKTKETYQELIDNYSKENRDKSLKIITKQEKIDNVEKRWSAAYPTTEKDIAFKLKNLNPKTEEGINNIIGNISWTLIICYTCHDYVDKVLLQFDSKVGMCEACLEESLRLMNPKKPSLLKRLIKRLTN